MANYFKHSVKISPVERQLEAPYEWYPHSSYNASSFGGTYHVSDNITIVTQYDDIGVLEGDQGASNKVHQVVNTATHHLRFVVLQNTGDSDILLKFDKVTPINGSGYSWYLGVNEIWATSAPTAGDDSGWQTIFAMGLTGHSKLSYMLGTFVSGGG